MRKNGYYWVEFLEFGAIDAVLFKDGAWRMENPITDAELRVIGDALSLPTPEQIAGHAERLKQYRAADLDRRAAPILDGMASTSTELIG